LFVVHSDVCGPIIPSTTDNKNYYVVFIYEYTHYCVTYIITYKSDVFSVFIDFIAKSEAHFNLKIVNLYIDIGREYISSEMRDFCVEKGISYHFTIPHTPQLNALSERMIRLITEKARSVINISKLTKCFWGDSVLTATYLINRSPSRALKERKRNKKSILKYLKIFCPTVLNIYLIYTLYKVQKRKFDDKSIKTILVGYEPNGYK